MQYVSYIPQKIVSVSEAARLIAAARVMGKTVAFTNGCFDILHEGHIYSLSQAAREADLLIVGLNADASVAALKGPGRPVNSQHSRALVLASLLMVDMVIIFEEATPIRLITTLHPDVLVKGGDYTVDTIVGAKELIAHGGRVVINPILKGFSTSEIIHKIKEEK